jgi:altronate dehydratase
MLKLEKNYNVINGKNQKENVKAIIIYGFDKELLENFPDSFEEGKEEMLFMFVPQNEDFTWFEKNININPYIVVMKSKISEKNLKMEIFEKIVDKMFEKQNEALEVHFSRIENNEIDFSQE